CTGLSWLLRWNYAMDYW
nr:immunoglobulin heavy chain junction region [Mus musculus]